MAKAKAKARALGRNVALAMYDAAVAVGGRGLLPLAEARAIVGRATAFERGEIHDHRAGDAARLWAALLSLEDAADFVRAAGRLDWQYHPRGRTNTALVERYGDGVLPWIAARVQDGILVDLPSEAIARRDASLFDPGVANTDWRLHATN